MFNFMDWWKRHWLMRARHGSTTATWIAVSIFCATVRAEFSTVINFPPTELSNNDAIESNTQVNVLPGGVLPVDVLENRSWQFREGRDNIEINLLGGVIGIDDRRWQRFQTSPRQEPNTNVVLNLDSGEVWASILATAGASVTLNDATVHGDLSVSGGSLATINGGVITETLAASEGSLIRMTGGRIATDVGGFYDEVEVEKGSIFLMSGGVAAGGVRARDALVSISGGRIERDSLITENSVLEVSGGSLGPLYVSQGSQLTLFGNEFQLDGNAINGFNGQSQSVEVPEYSVLTGILADGSPITISHTGYLHDILSNIPVNLKLTSVPDQKPLHFNAPHDDVPNGLHSGQSLRLGPGALAPANFTVLPNTSVIIEGGSTNPRVRGGRGSGHACGRKNWRTINHPSRYRSNDDWR